MYGPLTSLSGIGGYSPYSSYGSSYSPSSYGYSQQPGVSSQFGVPSPGLGGYSSSFLARAQSSPNSLASGGGYGLSQGGMMGGAFPPQYAASNSGASYPYINTLTPPGFYNGPMPTLSGYGSSSPTFGGYSQQSFPSLSASSYNQGFANMSGYGTAGLPSTYPSLSDSNFSQGFANASGYGTSGLPSAYPSLSASNFSQGFANMSGYGTSGSPSAYPPLSSAPSWASQSYGQSSPGGGYGQGVFGSSFPQNGYGNMGSGPISGNSAGSSNWPGMSFLQGPNLGFLSMLSS